MRNKIIEKAKDKVAEAQLKLKKRSLNKKISELNHELDERIKALNKVTENQEKIQNERNRLLGLNEKEILVEAIFAIRGFYSDFEKLKIKQVEMQTDIDNIYDSLSDLRNQINNLELSVNDPQDITF